MGHRFLQGGPIGDAVIIGSLAWPKHTLVAARGLAILLAGTCGEGVLPTAGGCAPCKGEFRNFSGGFNLPKSVVGPPCLVALADLALMVVDVPYGGSAERKSSGKREGHSGSIGIGETLRKCRFDGPNQQASRAPVNR